MYYYRLYGLTAASELEIPDAEGARMPQAACGADVAITLGPVPQGFLQEKKLEKLTEAWCYLVQSPKHFFMRCKGFDFEISDGSAIVVDIHSQDVRDPSLTTYILGSAFGVIGIQRGLVPIHGAALEIGGAAAIITGFAGSGKSAVLNALIHAGYRYLADDVSMVSTEGGRPFVLPSYPQRKVAVASAGELGGDLPVAATKIEDSREKYLVSRASEWLDEKLPVSHIVEIVPVKRESEPGFTPEISEITGSASLFMVLRNQYRVYFAKSIGTPPERMKQLLEVTSSIRAYQVIRPSEGFPVHDTARMIVEQCFGRK